MNNRRVGGDHAASMYRHPLLAGLTKILSSLGAVHDPSPRRVRWTPLLAGIAAVLMALDTGCVAGTRLADALACLGCVLRGRHRPPRTYNGLLKALCRQFLACFPALKNDLRRQVCEVISTAPCIGGWIILAVDGSKEDLPRTRSNTRAFGVGDNGAVPQAFITSIVSVTTGLLWDWRVDKARASEKMHLLEMLKDLPKAALLLGDGNFVGWPIWSALCAQGTDFLIRVGGNVDLLADLLEHRPASLRRASQIVYLWPKKRRATEAPLKLRLIRVAAEGRRGPVFLLTNVHDTWRLSVRRAGMIYRQRWTIEVFYRTLKRTLGVAKLRSTSGRRARVELNWALVALTVAGLLAVPAIVAHGISACRYSPAGALRILRNALMDRVIRAGQSRAIDMNWRLAHAVGDRYRRTSPKHARHRPYTKNTPRPLKPKPPILTKPTTKVLALARTRLNIPFP